MFCVTGTRSAEGWDCQLGTKHRLLFAGDQAIIAQDRYDAECMTKNWEIWTLDYKLKKNLLGTEVEFWRKTAGTS
jgi:hypothetical protein